MEQKEVRKVKKRIYIAEDERHTRNIIKLFLEKANYQVQDFENGDALYQTFLQQPADLVVLDIMMPGRDGLVICEELRKIATVPIIILTARDAETDFVKGMTAGSDDYMIKPFKPTQLLMKIQAIFRRIEMEHEKKEQKDVEVGMLRVASTNRRVFAGEKEIKVTATEFALLQYFAQHLSKAVSREELLSSVWGYETEVETRVVDENIRRLRKKLKAENTGIKIETVWGYGYRMDEKDET